MIGIDEVGRGCWAGPLLIVAARAIEELPLGLMDSKMLSREEREAFIEDISETCVLGEGWVQPEEIDTLGLTQAMKLGVARALISVGADLEEEIIMDGHINYCPEDYTNVTAVIKADALHPVVSAASIFAKVKRDTYMKTISSFYPGYEFEKHVGYGTKLHMEMLEKLGVTQLHRKSYKPVRQYITAA
jgi:ribonuclease HII